MWYTDFQLTDAAGNVKAGRLAAWALLCLAACVSALFTLYVDANNDKMEKVLQAKDQQLGWQMRQDSAKEHTIYNLVEMLDSCRFSHR